MWILWGVTAGIAGLADVIVILTYTCLAHSYGYDHSVKSRREAARGALTGFAVIPAIVAWPVSIFGLLYFGVRSLWKTAEYPTLAEKREERKASKIARLENDKRLLQENIQRLELEVRK